MADVRQIRNRLGLTQNQLASMLGVTQALLSYCENGLRDLPSRAWQTLRLLESFLEEPAIEQEPYLDTELAKSRDDMQRQYKQELTQLKSQRIVATHQLNIMRVDHEKYYRALQTMIPEWDALKDLPRYSIEVTKNYKALVKKYVSTDIKKQDELESKIRRLEMSIGEIESLLAGLDEAQND